MNKREQKERFIKKLAEYLVGEQTKMSFLLQAGEEEGKMWAELRATTPIKGWVSLEEGEKVLKEFLN